MAAQVFHQSCKFVELYEVNIKKTLLMCELAKAANASLVIAGSYAEYGLSALRYSEIPVDAPLEPTFPYAASKAAAGMLAMSYARSEKISLSYLRIFNAFGHGQYKSNLCTSLLNAAQNGNDFEILLVSKFVFYCRRLLICS